MQDEVKKVKVVGIEPKRYTSKKTQQEVMGFRMYFDKESEHVYGIAVREEWVSDDVYMVCRIRFDMYSTLDWIVLISTITVSRALFF